MINSITKNQSITSKILIFLNLIRYKNLLLIVAVQFIFRYGFLKFQNIPLALTDLQYVLLILSTVFLAAGGYVINDIFDQETESENKSNNTIIGKYISENNAYNIYVTLNIIGVGIGFYLSNIISKPSFSAIFILVAAALYFYATSLKQIILVGNLILAFLFSLSILIIGFFDLFPSINESNQNLMAGMFSILLDYSIFAFLICFIRELIKDLKSFEKDKIQEISTLPTLVGIKYTKLITIGLLLITSVIIFFYLNKNLMSFELYFASIYVLLIVIAPIIITGIKLWNSKTFQDYSFLNKILKWILFFGMISILIITLNIKNNA